MRQSRGQFQESNPGLALTAEIAGGVTGSVPLAMAAAPVVAAGSGLLQRAAIAGGLGADDSLSFEYGPEGSASGRIKYTGECICTSYEPGSPVGDVVTYSAEYQITGPVTRGTYSS
jgi:hypothetical protein